MAKSIAFKCTYNNGGEDVLVGFNGTCSRDNIARNMVAGRTWCCSSECNTFYKQGMKKKPPISPCYESLLFHEWQYGSGMYLSGNRKGTPIRLHETGVGELAILTTRFPNDREIDRKIIGLYEIGRINEEQETVLIAAPRGRIRLPLEEAKELYFWSYRRNNKGGPRWNTLLFRYLEDDQVHRMLEDVAATVRDEKVRTEVGYLIEKKFHGAKAPRAKGHLQGKSTNREKNLAIGRKYGPGGEGAEHRELKEWLAAHPEAIKLRDVISSEVEHSYVSGDLADIVFTHKNGCYTVVEVETLIPLPGAHQAIKYRSLLCAENGLSLSSQKVQSVLVAWSIPDKVRSFCEKYTIAAYELSPPYSASE